MEFAKNLKYFRESRGLSQAQLAEKITVTQQCVSEWENGKSEPSLSFVILISEVFGITIDELATKKH